MAHACSIAVWLAATACGHDAGPEPDGAPDRLPIDVADDDRAYELPDDCAALMSWQLAPQQHLGRVAAASAREAWVVVGSGELLRLRPDGSVTREPLDGVVDAWRCPGVTWAVGLAGLVARKPDDAPWQTFDLGIGFDFVDGGTGCDGDVWLGVGWNVYHHDGTYWRAIASEPTVLGDGTVLEHDLARVRAAARYRVATSNYGETLAYFPERDAFGVVAGTDDLISDAIVFRDGTGATLYHGHALAFDRDPALDDPDSPLDGRRAARRSDDDIWIAQGAVVRRFDRATITDETVPVFAEDVDARHDAVWAAGYGGAAVRSAAGWCHVAVVPP